MRVDEDEVRSALMWARNYGDIASFRSIATGGRRWLVRLPAGATVTLDGGDVGILSRVVPNELVLTSREALVFGYGVAVGGHRSESRRDFAAREWGWGTE